MNSSLYLPRRGVTSLAALVAALCAINTSSVYAVAKSLSEANTLLEAMGDPNDSSVMKNNALKIGGWLNTGVTYNSTDPKDKFNGPVTFGDRSAELQMNQLNLFVQRAVATEGKAWDFGGRFDIMLGSDAIFTQAYGVPAFDVNTGQTMNRGNWDLNLLGGNNNRFYGLALPQAYLEAYVPIGNGLNIKAGHFYTPIGYETVPAPDNFFYTHAYTMQYGEPFTHTGVMANYTINTNWAVMGGVTTGSATGGWDGGFNKQLGNWSGLMGATWTSTNKATSLNVSGTYGATSEHHSDAWAMYSAVLKHNFTPKTHLVLQHDHGFADNVLIGGKHPDAEWYGVNTHFYYDVHDKVSVGVRGEWFRDQNGFRVCSPGRVAAATDATGNNFAANFAATCSAASYYAVTAGLNWKPAKWINVRPNVRYDWSDGAKAFDAGNKHNQFLFSTDVTLSF